MRPWEWLASPCLASKIHSGYFLNLSTCAVSLSHYPLREVSNGAGLISHNLLQNAGLMIGLTSVPVLYPVMLQCLSCTWPVCPAAHIRRGFPQAIMSFALCLSTLLAVRISQLHVMAARPTPTAACSHHSAAIRRHRRSSRACASVWHCYPVCRGRVRTQ